MVQGSRKLAKAGKAKSALSFHGLLLAPHNCRSCQFPSIRPSLDQRCLISSGTTLCLITVLGDVDDALLFSLASSCATKQPKPPLYLLDTIFPFYWPFKKSSSASTKPHATAVAKSILRRDCLLPLYLLLNINKPIYDISMISSSPLPSLLLHKERPVPHRRHLIAPIYRPLARCMTSIPFRDALGTNFINSMVMGLTSRIRRTCSLPGRHGTS